MGVVGSVLLCSVLLCVIIVVVRYGQAKGPVIAVVVVVVVVGSKRA